MRAACGVLERYPTAPELLEALDRYWGVGGWLRSAADPQVYRGQRKRLKSAHARRDIPLSAGMVQRLQGHRSGSATDPGFTSRTYVHLLDDGLGHADFLAPSPPRRCRRSP